MTTPYKRAPITEAVMELRLAAPLTTEQVEKIKAQLIDDYPLSPQAMQNITIHPGSPPQPIIELLDIARFQLMRRASLF